MAARCSACRRAIGALLALGLLAGCAAAGPPQTDDPYVKLRQAEEMDRLGRLAVEERLIQEAIPLFQARGDALGLAEAYRRYGFYVRLYPEGAIQRRVPQGDALPPSDPARLALAVSYFERALAIVEEQGRYDMASNLEFNIGGTQHFAKHLAEACAAFERSRAAQHRYLAMHPDAQVDLPPGISSFDELIDRAKAEAGCA